MVNHFWLFSRSMMEHPLSLTQTWKGNTWTFQLQTLKQKKRDSCSWYETKSHWRGWFQWALLHSQTLLSVTGTPGGAMPWLSPPTPPSDPTVPLEPLAALCTPNPWQVIFASQLHDPSEQEHAALLPRETCCHPPPSTNTNFSFCKNFNGSQHAKEQTAVVTDWRLEYYKPSTSLQKSSGRSVPMQQCKSAREHLD